MMAAGPAVHLGTTDAATEAPGAPIRVFLSCRGVIHPAAFAGEFFCGPDRVGHDASAMRPTILIFPPMRPVKIGVIPSAVAAAAERAEAEAEIAPARRDIAPPCGSLPNHRRASSRRGHGPAIPTGPGCALRRRPRTSRKRIHDRRMPGLAQHQRWRRKTTDDSFFREDRPALIQHKKSPGQMAGAFSIRRIMRRPVRDQGMSSTDHTCDQYSAQYSVQYLATIGPPNL